MKTIDIQAKSWTSKTFGNTYFSAIVTIDYGRPTEKRVSLPFQYGYGDHYIDMANGALNMLGIIENRERLWKYCKGKGIALRTSNYTAKKRDVQLWGAGIPTVKDILEKSKTN